MSSKKLYRIKSKSKTNQEKPVPNFNNLPVLGKHNNNVKCNKLEWKAAILTNNDNADEFKNNVPYGWVKLEMDNGSLKQTAHPLYDTTWYKPPIDDYCSIERFDAFKEQQYRDSINQKYGIESPYYDAECLTTQYEMDDDEYLYGNDSDSEYEEIELDTDDSEYSDY